MSTLLPINLVATTLRVVEAKVARVMVDTIAVVRIKVGEAVVTAEVEVTVEVAVGKVAAATEVAVSAKVAAGGILEFTRPTNLAASITTGTIVSQVPEVSDQDIHTIDLVAEAGMIGEVAASAVGGEEVEAAVVGDVSVQVATIARVIRTRRRLDAFRVVDSGRPRATVTGVITTADVDAGTMTPTVEAVTADTVVPPAVPPAADRAVEEAVHPRVTNGIREASAERAAIW